MMKKNDYLKEIITVNNATNDIIYKSKPLCSVNDTIYGWANTKFFPDQAIVSSTNNWQTINIQAYMPSDSGRITGMHNVNNQYVMIATISGNIYRFNISNSSIEFIFKMIITGAYAENWSFTSDDNLVFVGEYGFKSSSNHARWVYMSNDYGATFTNVYSIPISTNAHLHKLLIDPYDKKLYVSNGDSPENRRLRRLNPPNYDVAEDLFNIQPTDGLVFENHILWCQDSYPYGVYKQNKENDEFSLVLDLSTSFPEYADTAYYFGKKNNFVYFTTHPDVNPLTNVGIWKSTNAHDNWELSHSIIEEGFPSGISNVVYSNTNIFLVQKNDIILLEKSEYKPQ